MVFVKKLLLKKGNPRVDAASWSAAGSHRLGELKPLPIFRADVAVHAVFAVPGDRLKFPCAGPSGYPFGQLRPCNRARSKRTGLPG